MIQSLVVLYWQLESPSAACPAVGFYFIIHAAQRRLSSCPEQSSRKLADSLENMFRIYFTIWGRSTACILILLGSEAVLEGTQSAVLASVMVATVCSAAADVMHEAMPSLAMPTPMQATTMQTYETRGPTLPHGGRRHPQSGGLCAPGTAPPLLCKAWRHSRAMAPCRPRAWRVFSPPLLPPFLPAFPTASTYT